MLIVTSAITPRDIMTRTSAGLLSEIRLAMGSTGMLMWRIIRSGLWIHMITKNRFPPEL